MKFDLTDVAPPSPTKGDMKEGLRGGKPQLSHIPMGAMVWAARVFQYGAHKYERGNFLRPQVDELADFDRLSAYLDAMLRHTFAVTGEMELARGCTELERKDIMRSSAFIDFESGLPHLAHALTGLMMAIQQGINAGILPADPGCPWEAK